MVLYNAAQRRKLILTSWAAMQDIDAGTFVKKIDVLANERGWKRAKIMIGPETFFNAKTCKNLRRGSPLLWC
jgi:hypothetical protein